MSRRALPAVLTALALTLSLAGPAHAAPSAPSGLQAARTSFWVRALTWLGRLIGPVQLTESDKGGLIDPNGNH